MNPFHLELKKKMDVYVHGIYGLTHSFPREELYGVTSQLRRSALSVILNYIEGYARQRDRVHKNFLEISYGSLKESKYLVGFAFDENYCTKEQSEKMLNLAEDIGAMLWGMLRKMD